VTADARELFVVRHWHAAHRCPAADPDAGAILLNHLSRAVARNHGIEIRAEAVVRERHSLFFIVAAADEARVREFMKPFARAGSVEVSRAATCAQVVATGGCADGAVAAVGGASTMEPEGACQEAIEDGLVVHRAHPLNCEAPISALIGGVVMPRTQFYVRNHFGIPLLDPGEWALAVRGAVERPTRLSLRELHHMRSHTMTVTLECAGNGRSLHDPRVGGEQWGFGGVSTAEWTGVPLCEVLERAGVRANAREVIFRGADQGILDGDTDATRFERSLPVDDAWHAGALLAYAMNGEPLPARHGAPVRLIVPSWYAMASVKWLTEIEVSPTPFGGRYQTDSYVYEYEGDPRVEPVTLQRVRAVIVEPRAGDVLKRGGVTVRGVAWSGAAPIARVEVSIGGTPWHEADLVGPRQRHTWQWWELITQRGIPGPTTIRARATDLAGRTQPDRATPNRWGYGNNSVHTVALSVE
jgi:DMSO/TMAO reductase YedYZ molybdopterin-dependent catalytic subunit